MDKDSKFTRDDEGYVAVRVVNSTEALPASDPDYMFARDVNGNIAVRVVNGAGSMDSHNLGWYATATALRTAHATAEDGDYAIVGETDTVWIWDSDTNDWVDSDRKGQVESVNGQTGVVVLTAGDLTTLVTVSASTLTQQLVSDTIYDCGELSALTITYPATPDAKFISQINFTSGTTPTAITSPVGTVWRGTDVATTFVPVANKRYSILFFYDGVNVRGLVQGV